MATAPGFILKMMNSVVNMMDYVLNMMNSALKMMDFLGDKSSFSMETIMTFQ